MNRSQRSSGFTLIETIVTIVVAGIVITGLFSSMASVFAISTGASQRTKASDLAYANMRLYANSTIPTWFLCDTSNETATTTVLSRTQSESGLPGDVIQTVEATAVYGCNNANQGYPIRVVSTVELISGVKVSHATYAGY